MPLIQLMNQVFGKLTYLEVENVNEVPDYVHKLHGRCQPKHTHLSPGGIAFPERLGGPKTPMSTEDTVML